MPTACIGSRRRKARVSIETNPRLASQRIFCGVFNERRGAILSQMAIKARIPIKKPNRMGASRFNRK